MIDSRGYRTDYSYDPTHGGLLTETKPAGANGIRPQTRYTYEQLSARFRNAAGALVSGSSIWKLVSTSTCSTQASCTGTADEIQTIYTYDDNLNIASETRRSGDGNTTAVITKLYDVFGNLASVDGPQTGSADTTRFIYNSDRELVATMFPDPDGSGPLPVPVRRTTYNSDGKPVRHESGTATDHSDSALEAMTVLRTLDTVYDAAGDKAVDYERSGGTTYRVTQYSYDSDGNLECTAIRMNPAAFDSLPGSACLLGPQGSFGADRITRLVYDNENRIVSVQRGYGTPAQVNERQNTYDTDNHLASITDANGNKAEYLYDEYHRVSRWTFPSKTTAGQVNLADYEEYGYDANDNRVSFRKRDGTQFAYNYDALDRLTQQTINGASPTTYSYNLRGLRLSVSDSLGATSFEYDGLGRMVAEQSLSAGRRLTYQYDASGNRTRVTHPDGSYFTYNYDTLNRLTQVLENGGPVVTSIAYDGQGRRSSITRAGSTTAYNHDGISRPIQMADDLAGTVNDIATGFTHNPASQIATRSRSNDAYRFTGYASTNRAYSVNGLNQYTTVGPNDYCYDANGNLTLDGLRAYKYDAENRLIEARAQMAATCPSVNYSGALQAGVTYDALGRLYQTSDGGSGITRFVYSGNELALELSPAGAILKRYVHGTGDDEPLLWYEGGSVSSATRRSLQPDHQGSIVSVADASGTMLAINTYDEFGVPGSGGLGRFRYTGQAWIPELGMYYFKARFYSPMLGRFLQIDPIGYDDQINLYAYVGNDPVNKFDPSGEDGKWVHNKSTQEVTIVIPVHFTGSAATPANIAAIESRVESLSIPNQKYKIDVVVLAEPGGKGTNVMDISPGFDFKRYKASGEGVERLGGSKGRINSDGANWISATAHDILHYVGIRDQYTEDKKNPDGSRGASKPKGDYDNTNIMTSRQGASLRDVQFEEARKNRSTEKCTIAAGREAVCK